MKRFSLREFALLCVPVLVVAVAGWFFSKWQTAPNGGPLRLVFRVDKPTVLEAFEGNDAVLAVELQGRNVGYGLKEWRIWQAYPYLEVSGQGRTQRSYYADKSSERWGHLWRGSVNGTRFPVVVSSLPAGDLRFGADAKLWESSLGATGTMPHIKAEWSVNRAQFTPYPFGKMARTPQIRLVSVKVLEVNTSQVRGEAVFNLLSAMKNPSAFDFNVREKRTSTGSGSGGADLTPETPTRRTREWIIYLPLFPKSGLSPTTANVSGRVSADNRWPLAFQIEPFDTAKVKAGQTLRFKSWPAPVPKS